MPKFDTKLLEKVRTLLSEKQAFVPMPGGDPAAMGGAPMPPPGDPAAMGGAPMPPPGGAPMDPMVAGGAPMDPMAAGGMPPPAPPMDPMAGGMPPAPPAGGSMITMSSDEFLKFVKQIVALCTSNKFGADPKPTDGGPVSDQQAALNAKVDAILQAIQG